MLSLAYSLLPFYVAAPLSRKPFKTHNNNAKFERDKIRTWAGNGNDYISLAGQAAAAGPGDAGREGGGAPKRRSRRCHCCHTALFHLHRERERAREAAIFIWPPCASLVPLSVTNGPVVKKAQNGNGGVAGCRGQWEAEIKPHESAIYTFKIQIKSFACRQDEHDAPGTDTAYALRLTSRLTFELGLDYFGYSIHLSSLVLSWPNLASAENTKKPKGTTK